MTQNVRTKETPAMSDNKEPFAGLWDSAVAMQRQWLGMWSQPIGMTSSPDLIWKQWRDLNTECLDHTRKTSDLLNCFVDDHVKIVREFSDKAIDRTRALAKGETKEVTPDTTREWFDTTRRCTERVFKLGNDTLKAVEDFGLKMSETLVKVPAAAK